MHGSSFPLASLSQGIGPKRSLAVTIINILGTGDVVAAAGALAGHALFRTPWCYGCLPSLCASTAGSIRVSSMDCPSSKYISDQPGPRGRAFRSRRHRGGAAARLNLVCSAPGRGKPLVHLGGRIGLLGSADKALAFDARQSARRLLAQANSRLCGSNLTRFRLLNTTRPMHALLHPFGIGGSATGVLITDVCHGTGR